MPKTFPTYYQHYILHYRIPIPRSVFYEFRNLHIIIYDGSYVMPNRIPATESVSHCWNEMKLFRSSSVSRTSYRRINELFTWTEKIIIFSSLFVHLWSTHFAIVCNVCKQKRTLRSDYWISFFSFFNEIIKIKLIKMSASNRMAKLLYCSTLLPSLDRYFESIEEIHSLCSDFCP